MTLPGSTGEPLTRDLTRSITLGLAWTGGMKGLTQVITWAMTIVVVRLLTPTDYGIFGLAMVFVQIIGLMTEFGLGSTLVYLNQLDTRRTAQLHGLSVLLGAAGLSVALLASYPLSRFFSTPEVSLVVIVLGLTFLVDSMKTVPMALLARDLQFKRLASLDMVKALNVSVATVILAAMGFGYWALVLGNVLNSLLSTVIVTFWKPQRALWPRVSELRGPLSFSADVIAARAAWYGYSSADFIVAGRLLGAEALGFYNCAATIASAPMEKIVSVFARVMPPLFSKVQHDPQLAKRYLLNITEVMTLVIVPACVGLAVVADDFVAVVLGVKWVPATMPLKLLCCYAAVHAPTTMMSHVLFAAGRGRLAMAFNLMLLAVLPVSFVVAARLWQETGIAAVWAVGYPVLVAPLVRTTLVAINGTVGEYVRSTWPALSGTLIMVPTVLIAQQFLETSPGPLRLALCIAVGAFVYGGSVFMLHRSRLGSLRAALVAA